MSQSNLIHSYFKPLSREQKEYRELRIQQRHRLHSENRAKATELIICIAADAMNIIDGSDIAAVNHAEQSNENPMNVGDTVQNAFQEILDPAVVHTVSHKIQQHTHVH